MPLPSPDRTPTVPPVPQRLLDATTKAHGVPWTATEEFRGALCEYVETLQRSGLDVVHTILAVKRALARVSPSLLEQSVKWCIEHYYRPG